MHVQGRTAGVLVALALTIGALSGPLPAAAEAAEAVPGELIVGFDGGVGRAEQRNLVADAGGSIAATLKPLNGALVATDGDASVKRQLARQDAVAYVEPNYVVEASGVPNDPGFSDQWGMRNSGQLGGNIGADIDAPAAWDVTTGGGVVVAVVDTGVAYDHPDLRANIWQNSADPPNGVDDDNDGFIDDTSGVDFVNLDTDPYDDAGHGTHVAGVIGAEGDNGVGIAGLNWNAQIMPLKFLDSNGAGNTADAAMAIDYAVAHGAQVINASWGGPAFSQTLYEAIRRAEARGVLFVAAAGNNGANSDTMPDYPAAFELSNVVSVAASDRYDHLLPYSNYGTQSVDLAAPGDDIYSTVPGSVDPSGYASFSGTSMAAPAVSGTAALYESQFPQARADQVKVAILQSVDGGTSFAGRLASGGRLNTARTLGANPESDDGVDRDPPAPFSLLRPRNHYATARRALRFRWRKSSDASGIKYYKVYVDGSRAKTIRDPDGPGGVDPATKTRLRLRAGRHRWYVKAYDYAGNKRRSRVSAGAARTSRSLYIGKRFK